jgi:hypothetical protein
MAETALDKALDGLDNAIEAVRDAAANLPETAEAAGDAVAAAAHGASGGAIDPFIFRFRHFRAGDFRRLLCRLVGDAGAAHAADGRHQRDFLGDRRRRAAGGGGVGLRARIRVRFRRPGACQCEHLRRLPRHADACSPCTRKKKSEALTHGTEPRCIPVPGIGYPVHLALRGLSHPTTSRAATSTA